jgi:hypothetical protein
MVEGVNSSKKYLIYYKDFCKCHNVPPNSTTIKKIFYKKTLEHLLIPTCEDIARRKLSANRK